MNLTTKQQIRVDIISKYLGGGLHYEDACNALEISERQFRRIVKAFREDGIQSVFHGNKKRTPCNKISSGLRFKIINLYRDRYFGLNLVHFIEKLKECDELEKIPSYSTIRNILLSSCLISPQVKRSRKSRPMRKRYEKEGIMVQIDGSHHRWFSHKLPHCLTLAMDDATGKILGAKFTKTETTFASMEVVKKIIEKHGTFQILYSDNAGIYGGGKRSGFSNMNRAMRELDIIPIQANSPQAKGRVERAFRTLQSRLISELRLNNIENCEEANRFLEDVYIDKFNAQFAVEPESKQTAYKPLSGKVHLNETFTVRTSRVVQSGEILSIDGNYLLLDHGFSESLFKKQVEVRKYPNGDTRVFYHGKELEWKHYERGVSAA